MKKMMIVAVVAVSAMFAAPVHAQEEEGAFIELFQGYLDVADNWVGMANRTDATVFFAIEGVVEIYEDQGDKAKAIPVIRAVLDKYPENQAVRNIVRFKLRELYRETGQASMALAELDAVIEENR